MAKKLLGLAVFLAASSGFALPADLPLGVLVATPLEMTSVMSLTPAPEPIQLPLNWELPAVGTQANVSIVPAFPGFRPSGDTEKVLFDANLVALVGLNVADYFSTREALKYPGLREANPLMQPFAKSPAAFAAIKIGTTALTYWSMKALFKRNRTVAWILTTASNALLSYVVASNMQRIHQARAL